MQQQHTDTRPVVASFVGTYLKPEMWHVYNQITGLSRYQSVVITRQRENAHLFPEPRVLPLDHRLPPWPWRYYMKFIRRAPREIYKGLVEALTARLAESGAALLHVYFGHEATRLALALRHVSMPWLVSFHGADLGRYVLRGEDRERLPLVFERARLVLARCEYFIPRLVALGCPREKIRLNRTHIRTELFPFRERQWPPAGGAWEWCQASRFIAKKGIADTIRAFAIFREKHPCSHLHLAGDGPQRAEIESLIRRLHLQGAVTLHGMLDRAALSALYARSHVFLHPSLTDKDGDIEGVPNSLLEAMCCGLIAVGTDHAGIPEVLRDGINGVLVPESAPEAIAEKLLALAELPERLGEISRAASQHVRENYTAGRQVALLEGYYSEALGDQGAEAVE